MVNECIVRTTYTRALQLHRYFKIMIIIIIVFSLTDEAMKVLFENDELYKILVDHIRNEGRTPKVRAAAILVIANMARSG